MVAYSRTHLIRHLPIGAAAGVGTLAAVSFLAMPADMLEALVWRSGVAALVPVAQPPLGITARAVLALGSGALGAAVVWSALYLLFGPGGFLDPAKAADPDMPVIRRADAHPDAPPRKPLSVADLGMPMMEVIAVPDPERPIPADLDQPLAAFDPRAIRPVPMEPARPVAPLVKPPAVEPPVIAPPVIEPSMAELAPAVEPCFARIETFDLPPVVATRPVVAEPDVKPSIEALLRRLEEGAGRRRHAMAN